MDPSVRRQATTTSLGAVIVAAAAVLAGAASAAPPRPAKAPERTTAQPRRVSGIASVPGGVVSMGDSSLAFLSAGTTQWRVLRDVPGDRVYRVASDTSGRLLVAWSNEPFIHVYSPARELVASLPKPTKDSDMEWLQLDQLELAPNGRDALVFMLGSVKATSPGHSGPSFVSIVYRIPLGGNAPAQRVLRADHVMRLQSSPLGLVVITNKYPGRKCDASDCLIGAVVAYEIGDTGANRRVLLEATPESTIDRASLVRSGAGDDRVSLLVDRRVGARVLHGLLLWRFGDPGPEVRPLTRGRRGEGARLYVTRAGELLEIAPVDTGLEIWRLGEKGDEKLAALALLTPEDPAIYGLGQREDGRLWVHYGDHLALFSPGQPTRSFSVARLLPRQSEWAGAALYVAGPTEQLWLGIDGTGRHYERVELARADREAPVWPAPGPGTKTLAGSGGGESVGEIGADPRDPSTPDRLRGAVTLRAYRGGLFSFGGPTLRILRDGDRRWLKVHTIPGDALYRVAADDDGRLLAAWEADASIHYFAPSTGRHVTIGKPAKPADFYDKVQVDELFFLPGGREALVYMQGHPANYSYLSTLVYRFALDGKSAPRLILRVDDAERVYTSARGALFVLREKPPLKDCNHHGCWPVTAIVACELPIDPTHPPITARAGASAGCSTLARSGDPVLPDIYPKKFDLKSYQVHLSSSLAVKGSSDDGIAVVVGLVQAQGRHRRNGGDVLLRWRWGQARPELRPLNDAETLSPEWLLTREGDFVEMRDGGDNGRSLVLRRYRAGGGEEDLVFPQLEKLARAYGIGERKNGHLWVHYGDHLGLVGPDGGARSVNISSLLGRKTEWAGNHVYVAAPESLWIGIDGRGRDMARVDLAAAGRRAKKWR